MPHAERPISPHLGIYRWQLTMVLSIVHRATGVALAVGTILLIALLLALAAGPEPYATVRGFCASPLGLFLLFGWTWSLCLHLCNGLRDLGWVGGGGFVALHSAVPGWIGQIAMLTGRTIKWDPIKMEILGDAGAAQMLTYKMRAPYQL